MKLEKFEKCCRFASDGLTKYDFIVLLFSYILCAIAKDLNLTTMFNVSGTIFLMIVMWYVCTFVCLLILYFIKTKKSKKSNIETLIDEESKKGEK